jgi:hypothetical protein
MMHQQSNVTDLLCGGCGYNLRGIPSDRCPECGRRFDPTHLIGNLIPWEQRRHIGRWRAFWRTAWMATFRPRRLAAKVAWPVDRSAARLFHAWVIALAAATLGAAACSIGLPSGGLSGPSSWGGATQQLPAALVDDWSIGVALGALAVWLILATVVVGCWYHPRWVPVERQNRADAISHYACAPLAWACAAVLAWCALTPFAQAWGQMDSSGQALLCLYASAILIVVQAIVWLWHRRRGQPARIQPLPAAVAAVLLALGLSWTWVGERSAVLRYLSSILLSEFDHVLLPAAALLGIVWCVLSIWLMKLASGCGARRAVWMAVALPLVWLALLAGVLLTVFAVFFMIAMLMAW